VNRGDELDRDISLALAKRVESAEPGFATARRLQREGKKLRQRYLSPVRNAGEIAKRDAVDWANGAGGNNPFPGADEAGKERWARRWLALYDVAFSHGGAWKPSSEGDR
jgi:hypothetical protein